MSASPARQAFEALATQLATITVSAGYRQTVRTILTDFSKLNLNVAESDLPLIEIVDDMTTYQHMASASFWAEMNVILFVVAPKAWTDGQMEDLISDIMKCLFGGSSNASGNTGITLGGVVQSIHLVDSRGDLNLIESNRTYIFKIMMKQLRKTYTG